MGYSLQSLLRGIRRMVVGVAALGVVATGVGIYESSQDTKTADREATESGWGAESLAESSQRSGTLSLMGVANACGLGASSCFKCHNGKRADAPDMDPGTAPWHTDHADVNHSCNGCHDGNPRIIRKAMSHRNLIANPNETPDKSCASCHDDEADEYLQRYLSAASGEK